MHESRQTVLHLLDASVRRRLAKTVLDMGGNAVLGYHQNFDVEGDSGIVARTYGTCVLLERTGALGSSSRSLGGPASAATPRRTLKLGGMAGADHSPGTMESLPQMVPDGNNTPSSFPRRSPLDMAEDGSMVASDQNLSPKSQAPNNAAGQSSNSPMHHPTWSRQALEAAGRHRDSQDDGDVQLLTLRNFDTTVRVRLGGLVTARVSFLPTPHPRFARLSFMGYSNTFLRNFRSPSSISATLPLNCRIKRLVILGGTSCVKRSRHTPRSWAAPTWWATWKRRPSMTMSPFLALRGRLLRFVVCQISCGRTALGGRLRTSMRVGAKITKRMSPRNASTRCRMP